MLCVYLIHRENMVWARGVGGECSVKECWVT